MNKDQPNQGINWRYAYTPFLARMRGGHAPDMQGFMRTVYCASVKVPQDSAAHIVGRSHDYVVGIYKMIRFVTAWAELQKNVKLGFAPGVLEIDSCRTTSQKKPVDKRKLSAKAKAACKRPASKKTYKKPSAKAQIHGGRFLVAVSRKRKEAAFFPLPNHATVAGAPGPPDCCRSSSRHRQEGHLIQAHCWIRCIKRSRCCLQTIESASCNSTPFLE